VQVKSYLDYVKNILEEYGEFMKKEETHSIRRVAGA
jgi:hypothetical protein